MRGIPEATIQKLLEERKAMCNCGCGWGDEDGHEWEIILLERLLNETLELGVKDDS